MNRLERRMDTQYGRENKIVDTGHREWLRESTANE